jgi:hypothetical protein
VLLYTYVLVFLYTSAHVGYVVVRCTVTIDVDVLDTWATAWFISIGNLSGGLSPNQEDVSVSSIVVKNQSSGAVLKYAVVAEAIHRTTDGGTSWVADTDDIPNGIKGWTLSTDGNNDGIGKFVLAAVFANSRPAISDFGTSQYDDQLRSLVTNYNATELTNHTYKVDTNFTPADSNKRYPSALGNTTGVNAISPSVDANNPRGLWFYIKTPQAVTDEYPRRITIRVYGTTVSSSW